MGVGCLLGVLPGMCCCFFSEPLQRSRMAKMCDRMNAGGTLPRNVRVDYKCAKKRHADESMGGVVTTNTYHNVTFSLRA